MTGRARAKYVPHDADHPAPYSRAAYVPRHCPRDAGNARTGPKGQRLLKLMAKGVGVALRHQRNKGRVVDTDGPGQYKLWEIVR